MFSFLQLFEHPFGIVIIRIQLQRFLIILYGKFFVARFHIGFTEAIVCF